MSKKREGPIHYHTLLIMTAARGIIHCTNSGGSWPRLFLSFSMCLALLHLQHRSSYLLDTSPHPSCALWPVYPLVYPMKEALLPPSTKITGFRQEGSKRWFNLLLSDKLCRAGHISVQFPFVQAAVRFPVFTRYEILPS
jgi:hypothetical protein